MPYQGFYKHTTYNLNNDDPYFCQPTTSIINDDPYFCFPEIQFANDVVIVTEAHNKHLRTSSNPPRLVSVIQNILACDLSSLPITYLGLQLTLRKPRKFHYQPILEGYKLDFRDGKPISYRTRRVTPVKSVLSAMPRHYMQVLN